LNAVLVNIKYEENASRMNWAKFLGEISYTSERGVRVWFSRKKKSLESMDDVRDFLKFKFSDSKARSDKGTSRETPWLNDFKYKKQITSGACVVCGNTTKLKKQVWNEKFGEEIEIFICHNCAPRM
jgi:hypothetical protein